jgi:curved DNA-binding protein CbpA
MIDPYEVFELATDASESEIRKRYLELVRAFPPDRAPERFAEIHAAYAALRDPAERLRRQLFSVEDNRNSIESIVADLKSRLRGARIPTETLLSWTDSP